MNDIIDGIKLINLKDINLITLFLIIYIIFI